MADVAFDPNIPPSMMFGRGNELVAPPPEAPPSEIVQGDQPPIEPPQAFSPGWVPPSQQQAPITPGVGQRPPPPPPEINEQEEQNAATQYEEQKFGESLKSHQTGKEITPPTKLTLNDFPQEKAQIERLRELQPTLPDRKSYDSWGREIARLEKIVSSKIDAQNKAAERLHQQKMKDETRQADEKRMTTEQRVHQSEYLKQAIGDLVTESTKARADPEPKEALTSEYSFTVSPLNTLNVAKPGQPPQHPQLVQTANNVANVNGHLLPDQVMRNLLLIGSPINVRDNPHQVGLNGRKGSGGTNYQVIGRDPRDNFLLEMPDGTKISISRDDKRLLDGARVRGYAAGKKLLADETAKKEAASKPGLIERTYQNWFPAIPKAP